MQVLRDRSPELVLSGVAGSGKSRAILEKLLLIGLKYPKCRILVVRKTAESLTSTGLVTWREKVAPEFIANGDIRFYGGSREEPAAYRFRNGSIMICGGMDKPTKIMSSEFDVAYVQEATELSVEAWEAINSRLRNGVVPYQQLLADCNPEAPWHWLKRRCDEGRARMLESRHEDNPVLFYEDGEMTAAGAAYLARLDALTGVRYLRLRKGLWVAADGLIYEDFDPAVHVIDPFKIPDSWSRWWTVDFGFIHPFVLQCWAEDHDGRLYLYREIYRTQRLVEDHARDILSIVAPGGVWNEPRPEAVICDHDAEDRATLARHLGMRTTSAKKTVSDGLQAVATRLRPAGDGRRRIALLRGCTVFRDPSLDAASKPASTAEEFAGYVWADKQAKEEPVKYEDDGLDALRYMVAARDLRSKVGIRRL